MVGRPLPLLKVYYPQNLPRKLNSKLLYDWCIHSANGGGGILYANHFYLIVQHTQHSNYLSNGNYAFIIFKLPLKGTVLNWKEANHVTSQLVKKHLSVWRSQNKHHHVQPLGKTHHEPGITKRKHFCVWCLPVHCWPPCWGFVLLSQDCRWGNRDWETLSLMSRGTKLGAFNSDVRRSKPPSCIGSKGGFFVLMETKRKTRRVRCAFSREALSFP